MYISNEDVKTLKVIHGAAQMGFPLATDLILEAKRMEREGLVKINDFGIYEVENDTQWSLIKQGIVLPQKIKRSILS